MLHNSCKVLCCLIYKHDY
uniref:Uncharacterized protein n=1 Tax=Arundo donax TaxID=35708 RepID=A0A0A9AVN5_ARUDO